MPYLGVLATDPEDGSPTGIHARVHNPHMENHGYCENSYKAAQPNLILCGFEMCCLLDLCVGGWYTNEFPNALRRLLQIRCRLLLWLC